MSKIGNYNERCVKIAERFLLTAVIVDDEAQIQDSPRPSSSLRKPDRHTLKRSLEETSNTSKANTHSLDAHSIVGSFAKHGLICAVIVPPEDDSLAVETVIPVAKRADLVIVDWHLHDDDGKKALTLLKDILKNDDVRRLRLIAVYTGEEKISKIRIVLSRSSRTKDGIFN